MSTLTTVYGANNTIRDQTIPAPKLKASNNYGRLRILYDEYTLATGDNFGTSGLIKMMKIPAGAKLIQAHIHSPDLGTTGIVDVGYAASADGVEVADADGIFAQADCGGVALNAWMTDGAALGKEFAAEVEVQIDFTEASAGSGSRVIKLSLFIAVD